MQWIAPSEKDQANNTLEKKLWDAADQFRANSGLTASQYSAPVLGMIFLRFAETRFEQRRTELEAAGASSRRSGSRVDDPGAYHAESVMYLPETARFAHLLAMPEGGNIGQAINDAMGEVEKFNPQLAGVLPRSYQLFESTLLKDILKKISEIPVSLEYDAFGRIYEYFLGAFARTEGQKGGEFYTPSSIVRLLVEVIEPFHGKVLDPACGSGGMFVQSARFVSEHHKSAADELSIHGVEKTDETGRLARMNLAIHGLEGDIRHGGHINSYYDDPHDAVGGFDFVLANPPFNVNAVDKERLESDVGKGRRYPFGLPRTDNGNYLWIQLFYSSLNDQGRAGFVMANSASDARASEMELRRQLIEAKGVDVMVAVGPNMFYTVTLPCTLWFMDKAKAKLPPRPPSPRPDGHPSPTGRGAGGEGKQHGARYCDTVLFIDARHIYRQIDRAHRDWTEAQNSFIANIVRLYRGESPDFTLGGTAAEEKLRELFAGQPSPVSSPSGRGRGEGAAHGRGGYVFSGLVERAGELRSKQTPAEAILWDVLRDRQVGNLKFRRQHQIGDYIVDFYCHELQLVIEADGGVHDAAYQQKHDQKRDAYLSALGMTVKRFSNEVILNDLESILVSISSSPVGRGGGEGASDFTHQDSAGLEGASDFAYRDIAGLCKAATLEEIEAQGWSLNPGRYVGVTPGEEISDEDFKEKLEALNEELEVLNAEARELEATIAANVAELLEA